MRAQAPRLSENPAAGAGINKVLAKTSPYAAEFNLVWQQRRWR